jgi:uncharacterized protein YggU (UPF0235/DUF167 family)
MTRKHWVATNLVNQAKEEDSATSSRMLEVANHIRKCGSTTIWDVAMRGYNNRLKNGINSKKPEVEEYVEWRGKDDDLEGNLSSLGFARCKRIQCPVCCYTRTLLRRNLALKWASEKDWTGYYAVMVTFTVSHKLSDSEESERFSKVLERLNLSMKRFASWFGGLSNQISRGYKSPDPDSLGYLSSLEFTFGKNGLHPHFHTLFFTRSESDVENLREFFKKDRVRVWKDSGQKLLRMPKHNESESFKIFCTPMEGAAKDKVISYISKGLFEAMSSVTKVEQKTETSKSIFQLSGHELKYFCTFFESTRGKRFYRAGGVCKSIMGVNEALEEKKEEDKARSSEDLIFKLAQKDKIPEGWVTEFLQTYKRDFDKSLPHLSVRAIKKKLSEMWDDFQKEKSTEWRVTHGVGF